MRWTLIGSRDSDRMRHRSARRGAFHGVRRAAHALVIGSNPGCPRIGRCATPTTMRSACATCWSRSVGSRRTACSSCGTRAPPTSAVRCAKLANTARDSTNEDTLVFVYYSGHADDKHRPPARRSDVAQGAAGHAAQPARDHQARIIDACKSGSVTRRAARRPTSSSSMSCTRSCRHGAAVEQRLPTSSPESRALQGSVFTHHLVSGMRGAADEDNDQQVSIHGGLSLRVHAHARGGRRADRSSSARRSATS